MRELKNAVERAVALGDTYLAPDTVSDTGLQDLEVDPSVPFKIAKRRLIERFERPYLEKLIAATSGNVSAAARQAGIDRVHLLKLLHQYGLR